METNGSDKAFFRQALTPPTSYRLAQENQHRHTAGKYFVGVLNPKPWAKNLAQLCAIQRVHARTHPKPHAQKNLGGDILLAHGWCNKQPHPLTCVILFGFVVGVKTMQTNTIRDEVADELCLTRFGPRGTVT